MSQLSDQSKAVLEATAVCLKDLKEEVAALIDDRVGSLDPTMLAKSVEAERLQQTRVSVLGYLDSFLNERSEVVKGEASGYLKRAL